MNVFHVVVAAAGGMLPGLAAAWDWQGSAGVLSDKIVYGISQSGGRSSTVLDLSLRAPGGWFASAGIATLDAQRGNAELSLSLGHGGAVGDLGSWGASVAAFTPLGEGPLRRPAYQQLGLAYGWNERLQLALWWAPNQPGPALGGGRTRGRGVVAEASWSQPLADRLAIDVGFGQVDYGRIAFAPYRFGSVGLNWGHGPLQVFVTRVFSDSPSPNVAGPRAVVSVLVNF